MSETTIRFKLETSIHGMPSVSATGLPVRRHRAIARFVCENLMSAEAYKAKQGVTPFLQGFDEHDGWVMIEFWGNDQARIDAYIVLLNNELTRPLADWEN